MTAAEPSNTKETDAAKAPASKGERLYNFLVYNVVNYWVNLFSSLAIADYFIHLKGKAHLDKGAAALGKLVASTKLLPLDKAVHHSRTALKTLALTSGGWGLLIPGTMAENKKRSIVYWFNDKLGVDQRAPDGRKLTPEEIHIEEEQPHQTPMNAIIRRAFATLAVVGSGQAINAIFRDRRHAAALHGDDHHGGKAVVERFVVGNVNKVAKAVLPVESGLLKEGGLPQRWLGMAALDTFFTMITASVMYMTNGAKKMKEPKAAAKPAKPAVPAPPSEPETLEVKDAEGKPWRVDKKHPDLYKKKPVMPMENYAGMSGAAKSDSLPAL